MFLNGEPRDQTLGDPSPSGGEALAPELKLENQEGARWDPWCPVQDTLPDTPVQLWTEAGEPGRS